VIRNPIHNPTAETAVMARKNFMKYRVDHDRSRLPPTTHNQ